MQASEKPAHKRIFPPSTFFSESISGNRAAHRVINDLPQEIEDGNYVYGMAIECECSILGAALFRAYVLPLCIVLISFSYSGQKR